MKRTAELIFWYSLCWFARNGGLHAERMTMQGAQQSFNRASSHGCALRMCRKHAVPEFALHRGVLHGRITAEEQARNNLPIAPRAVGALCVGVVTCVLVGPCAGAARKWKSLLQRPWQQVLLRRRPPCTWPPKSLTRASYSRRLAGWIWSPMRKQSLARAHANATTRLAQLVRNATTL